MNKAIVGRKIGMSQVFTDEGIVIPVTVIEAGPCTVVQKKTIEKDGYEAIQVSFGEAKKSRINKPLKGHYDKSKLTVGKLLKEFRIADCSQYEVGSVISCDIFSEGSKVDVQGKTKGHGFSGTIKRWNFSRGPMAHGSGYHRGVGALSACAYPGKVFKNRKLPGQFGNETVTIQNLTVVRVLKENNAILVKGSVPGAKGSIVFIKDAVKN